MQNSKETSTHKNLVERPRHKWNYNNKIKLKYDVCGRDLSNSETQSLAALINIVIYRPIPSSAGNFLTSSTIISFSRWQLSMELITPSHSTLSSLVNCCAFLNLSPSLSQFLPHPLTVYPAHV